MDIIQLIATVIDLTQKNQDYSQQVMSLKIIANTLSQTLKQIFKIRSITDPQSELLKNIHKQLEDAQSLISQLPKQMSFWQKTLTLLPGNILQRIKQKNSQLLQSNALLQTFLQTSLHIKQKKNQQIKRSVDYKIEQNKIEKKMYGQEKDIGPTLLDDYLGPTLIDKADQKSHNELYFETEIISDFPKKFQKQNKLRTKKKVQFGPKKILRVFTFGRSDFLFLQSQYPKQIKSISKQHFHIYCEKIEELGDFNTCKEDLQEMTGVTHIRMFVQVLSSNGAYFSQNGKQWIKLTKQTRKEIDSGTYLTGAMKKPQNFQALFSVHINLN